MVRTLATGAAVAGAYLALAIVGLQLASFGEQVSLLWLPSGVALGALFLLGRRMWPAVWLGALAANLYFGTALPISLLIASGNTLAAAYAAHRLARAEVDPRLDTLRDVRVFAHQGAGVVAAMAASSGTLALLAGGLATLQTAPKAWIVWFMGDVTGALLITPLLLTVANRSRSARLTPTLRQGILVAGSVLMGVVGFMGSGPIAPIGAGISLFGVITAAAAYGLPAGTTLAFALALLAQIGAARGTGLFASSGESPAVITWSYVTFMASASLMISSLQAERIATQRREAELEAAAREAHRLESLGVISAGVAHDFNNILQVIAGYADLARRDARDTGALDHVQSAVQRGALLCQQLEAYAGLVPSKAERIGLTSEVHRFVPLLMASLPQRASLRVDLPPDDTEIRCDKAQLRQIVVAVVSNAAEAVDAAGGGQVHLQAGHSPLSAADLAEARIVGPRAQPGEYGWLSVSDDGPGMAPETVHRIFEPFFTTRFLGRGLGLAAVAGIMRSHQGAIFVRSTLGAGTVVRVAWPVSDPAEGAGASTRGALPSDQAG